VYICNFTVLYTCNFTILSTNNHLYPCDFTVFSTVGYLAMWFHGTLYRIGCTHDFNLLSTISCVHVNSSTSCTLAHHHVHTWFHGSFYHIMCTNVVSLYFLLYHVYTCDFNVLSMNVISTLYLYPPQRSCGGVYWNRVVRPSVHPSVRPSVRPSVDALVSGL
jgi:hypothetical protein